MEYIRTLRSVHRGEEEFVGERAVDLALLEQKEYQVPLTFILNNEAFEAFIVHNKLQERIGKTLLSSERERVYEVIRELLLGGEFPHAMVREIVESYESLGVDIDDNLNEIVKAGEAPFVNVMLSPNHTIPPENHEGIILNVRGLEELLLAIKEAWACLFTPSLQQHRTAAGIGHRNLNTSVIVQHMTRGELSAEASSMTGSNVDEIQVKSYYGFMDIGKHIEKDEFRLTREFLKPVFQSVATQTYQLARDEDEKLGKLPLGTRGEEQKANDRVMIELGRLAKKASQLLDHHVKLILSVSGEKIRLLLCNRLLPTQGSIKLQGYQAEEKIELTEPTLTTKKETKEDIIAEETGEEEIIEQHATEEVTEKPEAAIEESKESPEVSEMTDEARMTPLQEAVTDSPTEEVPDEHIEEVPDTPNDTLEEADPLTEEEETDEAEEELADETESEEEDTEPTEPASEEPDSIFAGVVQDTIKVEEETSEVIEHDEQAETLSETREEETIVAVDDETGEEEIVEEDVSETPTRSIGDAYEEIIEALTKRYEARFRNQPPENVETLFFELSSEVIIPHEELIGRLVHEWKQGIDEELKTNILGVVDDFLEKIL